VTLWLNFVLAIAATILAHEAGHATVAQALRLPWKPTWTRHGPGVRIGSDAITLTRRQIIATSLGGPLANLVLVAIGYELGLPLLVLFGLDFAVFNLVRIHRFGWRLWVRVFGRWWGLCW
jgi:hypothetical protein